MEVRNEIQKTMFKEKRIASGLGDPPEPFYTNDVESQNNVIKHQMSYKTQELPQFISSMKTMMINQRKEIEKAVAGIGEYRLVELYKHLAIDTRKFFQMSDKQREKAVKAVFTTSLEAVEESSLQDHTPPSISSNPDHTPPPSILSISDKPAENKLLSLPIPAYLADKVWDESTNVLAAEGSVYPSPGCKDRSEWLVKSTDLKRKSPYFVECRKNGQVVCEPSCGLFKSSKVCVHTVSVARHTGELGQYLHWLLKQKEGTLNVSKLAAVDMPAGSGKKGSRRKASQKKSTKAIKNILDESTGSHTYRVDPASCSSDPLPFSSASQVDHFQASSDDDMVSAYDDSLTTGEPFYPAPTLPSHPLPLHPSQPSHPPLPPPLLPDVSYSRCGQPPPLTGVTQHVTLPYSPMVYAPVMMGLSPHQQVESSCTNAFWLRFVKGNISRCTGCGQRTLRAEDGRPRLPPYNLCLQHKEYVFFENPRTGLHQLSSEHRNVYYHASQRCVTLKYKDFNPRTDVKVASDIRSQLTATHLDYIMQEFGLAVLNA